MRTAAFLVAACLSATAALAAPVARPEPAEGSPVPRPSPGELMAQALDTAEAGYWNRAEALATRVGDPVAVDIVRWIRLREGVGTWSEYTDFLDRNPDWPGLSAVRRAAERHLPEDLSPAEVIAFFEPQAPQTGTGARLLATALLAEGRGEEAGHAVRAAWLTLPMSAPEQDALAGKWEADLADQHEARLDAMLWAGLFGDAERMFDRVDAGWRELARARIMTRRDAAGLMAQIGKVPAELGDDPGLAFERYRYRVERGRWDDAESYLLEKSVSREALGRPEMWMERRANLARQALRAGRVEDAYALAANSFGTDGAAYADAEWVAGFIALVHMQDAELAAAHFERFTAVVSTPISLGRAGYWLGRAREAAGDAEGAQAAYAAGAQHQTSFYGQLAAERAGLPADPGIVGGPEIPNWRRPEIRSLSVVRAAELMHAAGVDRSVAQFLRHAAEDAPAEVRAALAQMARDLGRPHIGLRIAKDAASQGMIIVGQYYPLHIIAGRDWPVPTELALAVARQESEFNDGAVSSAGAGGLMQLMPRTAESVANGLGVAYEPRRVGRDGLYNARLGTAYLARMLERYDGSYVLAAAAYNAGPGRVDDWLEANGDPRSGAVDPVLWIENIPFSETRNYVMRVLEGLHVYRARLTGAVAPIRLEAELAGTG